MLGGVYPFKQARWRARGLGPRRPITARWASAVLWPQQLGYGFTAACRHMIKFGAGRRVHGSAFIHGHACSRSFRSRNILEMWKVRSPCNVHKHSKHRRTPLYLLELAVRVGRSGRQRWFCSHCQTHVGIPCPQTETTRRS